MLVEFDKKKLVNNYTADLVLNIYKEADGTIIKSGNGFDLSFLINQIVAIDFEN